MLYQAPPRSPPTWSTPTEGPFSGLSYWSELSSNKISMAGGGNLTLAPDETLVGLDASAGMLIRSPVETPQVGTYPTWSSIETVQFF